MRDIPLPFPINYIGSRLITVEDASEFILNLPQQRLDAHHWRAAHIAFSRDLMEPNSTQRALP